MHRIVGISVSTFRRWENKGNDKPKKKKYTKKLTVHDLEHLRRIAYDFYCKKMPPTTIMIKNQFQLESGKIVSEATVLRGLHEIGFTWKRLQTDKVKETDEHIGQRLKYLTAIRKAREEKRPIYYLDESFYHSGYKAVNAMSDKSGKCTFKIKAGKGKRVVMVHIGNESGNLDGAFFVFDYKKPELADYHKEMNSHNFEKWFIEKVLPHLPDGAVVVMDNAPYHGRLIKREACRSHTKATLIHIITVEHGIPMEELPKNLKNPLRPPTNDQLYQFATERNLKKQYSQDEYLKARGMNVVRLPPYHAHFNPIELFWNYLKSLVASLNVSN